MKNAFPHGPVRVYRVWGDGLAPHVDLVPGTRCFVCYSPLLRSWVLSITSSEYRYDALVSTSNFRLDASLLPVDTTPDGPTYYLERLRNSTSK